VKSKADVLARLGRAPRVRASVYEGAGTSRRTLNWRAPTTFPNQVLGDLVMLRDRSRGRSKAFYRALRMAPVDG